MAFLHSRHPWRQRQHRVLILTTASLLVRTRRVFLGGPGCVQASGSDEPAVQLQLTGLLCHCVALRKSLHAATRHCTLTCGPVVVLHARIA